MVLAALSLLGPTALAFDPIAWLIWGEQLAQLRLDTDAGPSWKPLPVVIAAALSLAGPAAPELWLLVARASALMGLFAIAALGWRLGGRPAGLAAGAIIAVSPWWWYNAALGNSEGLLAAAIGWAVVAHLAGRPRLALIAGAAAAAIRAEVALFFLAYCAFLAVRSPQVRRDAVAAAAVATFAWVGPDLLGGGGALRAASAAHGWASPGSAQNADAPVLAVFADALSGVTLPAALAVVAGLVLRARSRRLGAEQLLAALALSYVALVVAMTGLGYAGNPRYLVPAFALLAPVAALGAVRLGRRISPPGRQRIGGGLAALALVALVLAAHAPRLAEAAADVRDRAAWSSGLVAAIDEAGGAARLRTCPHARTPQPWRALVAYRLDMPFARVTAAQHPGSVVLLPPVPAARPPSSGKRTVLARAGGWRIWDCLLEQAPGREDQATASLRRP